MWKKAVCKLILFTTLLGACSSPLAIEGFEPSVWQADKQACGDQRMQFAIVLNGSQDLLLERSQNELEAILGLPDEHELDKRRQKFFFYYLEPGPDCSNPAENPIQLQIRFNAVGLSSEVFLLNY